MNQAVESKTEKGRLEISFFKQFLMYVFVASVLGLILTYFWPDPDIESSLFIVLLMMMSTMSDREENRKSFLIICLGTMLTCVAGVYSFLLSSCCVMILFPDKTPLMADMEVPSVLAGLYIGLLIGLLFSFLDWLFQRFASRPEKTHPLVAAMENPNIPSN